MEGRRFRRQHSIGSFIVDFYCHQERLIIEVDGAVHDDPYRATYDAERQQVLQEEGHRVLRFTNEMVEKHCEEVLSCIADAFVEGVVWGIRPSSCPSPLRRRDLAM